MNVFSKEDVESALIGVCDILNVTLDKKLHKEYQNGATPTLLSYEKVEKPALEIPAIQKYLIGVQTFLNQPCQYYDIFRACRHVIFIQHLNNSLLVVQNKVKNFEKIFEKLTKEINYDSFEGTFYELLIAANYAANSEVSNVKFIDESSSKTPDLEFELNRDLMYIECKKFDRTADFSLELRDLVRDKSQLTFKEFLQQKKSAIIEITFHKDPKSISPERIHDACIEAYIKQKIIIDTDLTVNIINLKYEKLKDFALYPSPKYYWERYEYRMKDEWFGIVCSLIAKFAHHKNIVSIGQKRASTWLDDVNWECAIKWKISDENIIWRYKKLAYNRLFKGLTQLRSKGTNTILHAWFERDHPLGHRQNELVHFYNTLKSNARDIFSWIIFNETSLEVSPKGHFDLIEYAHILSGPGTRRYSPIVTNVFTKSDNHETDWGEFGIGFDYPDIDDVYE